MTDLARVLLPWMAFAAGLLFIAWLGRGQPDYVRTLEERLDDALFELSELQAENAALREDGPR